MKLTLGAIVTVTTIEREAQRMIFRKEVGREVSQRTSPWIRASGAPCARNRQAELAARLRMGCSGWVAAKEGEERASKAGKEVGRRDPESRGNPESRPQR